ncbi:MAG: class I SAM-dependent methyltransferase [Chloroflexota bacterium]
MREKRYAPRRRRPAAPTSWDALARWYDGWVGEGGSEHHQRVAIPAVMRLLDLKSGDRVLDVGAGQGVLAQFVARKGGRFVGIDASPRLLEMARQRHGKQGTFLLGDARRIPEMDELDAASFDAVVFLLSLQDMDPLEPVLAGAAWALKPAGKTVILLTHPAFRIPRQSGWGWDEGRKLMYRRVDRYKTPLPVPMKAYPGKEQKGVTRSFHRPIEAYVNLLGDNGLLVDRMDEVPGYGLGGEERTNKAAAAARREIPLFLGIRARKLGQYLTS